MDYLSRLPVFSRLAPVELAKLLPDLQEVCLKVGQELDPSPLRGRLLCVVSGRLELHSEEQGQSVWITQATAGDLLGEGRLSHPDEALPSIRAVEPTVVVSIAVGTFANLLEDKPEVLHSFSQTLIRQQVARFAELERTRRMLAAYSEKLWDTEPEVAGIAVSEQVYASATVPLPSRRDRLRLSAGDRSWRPAPGTLVVLAATVLAGALAFLPVELGLAPTTRAFTAILLWGSICWLFNALPDYVVALTACLGVAVFGLSTPAAALSGFASSTWFLLLGVWCIGVAVGRTGLLYRIALHMLKLLPGSYIGQSLALAITGTLMTPLLPSSQGRTVMAAPLTLELGEAMRFPARSSGSAGLAMASFLGFGQMYFLVPNGTTTGILAWSLLPDNIRSQATWLFWLVAALPLGLFVFAATYWATVKLLPAGQPVAVSRQLVQVQLKVLGPMRQGERMSLLVMFLVLAAFASAPIHGFDPSWFAVGGMLLLMATGVLDKDSLGREVDWSFLLFFGAILSLAAVAREAQLDLALSGPLRPLLQPVLAHPALAVLGVGVLTVVLRLAVSPLQAIPILTIALIPVFVEAGLNPLAAVIAIMAASTTFVAPLLSPGYTAMLAGTRGRMFTGRQITPLAVIHTLILLAGLLLSGPFWRFLSAL